MDLELLKKVVIIISLSLMAWTFGHRTVSSKEPVGLKKQIKHRVHNEVKNEDVYPLRCFSAATFCDYRVRVSKGSTSK